MARRAVGSAVGSAHVLLALVIGCKASGRGGQADVGAWTGTVEEVVHAGKEAGAGLQVCAGTACDPARAGKSVPGGGRLVTDGRTRARVKLSDGSVLVLDRDTDLSFSSGVERKARMAHGSVALEAASGPAPVTLELGDAQVVASGARLQVLFDEGAARVTVVRGIAELSAPAGARDEAGLPTFDPAGINAPGGRGRGTPVLAGQEAQVDLHGRIAVSTGLARSELAEMRLTRDASEAAEAPVGIGELLAKKTGESDEKRRLLHISKHSITARVVDMFARTEVSETFSNDSDDQLEGVYRFPLPPTAEVESLSLEVDGKLVRGAFVERDKAKRIFQGAIQNAIDAIPKPVENVEFIWRPGPWRDPALLEWQRGGRFELRIFPIAPRSSRRVVIGYTETLPRGPGSRTYRYELPFDPNSQVAIGQFDADVQVIGQVDGPGMRVRGYPFVPAAPTEPHGERVTFSAASFIPSGDFQVSFALPGDEHEVTAYGYEGGLPPEAVAAPVAPPARSSGGTAAPAFQSLRSDEGYVAFAVRPRLPGWTDASRRDYVIVLDASRSMTGERFARATKLAVALVRDMDPRDHYALLVCDDGCRSMQPTPTMPGPAAADEVSAFLGGVETEGATDLLAAVRGAMKMTAGSLERGSRVVYIGDGAATVGPTTPSHIAASIRAVVPSHANVTAVAIGSDCDVASLAALARGGGGTVVPFLPGESATTAARAVLGATAGVVLRSASFDLPRGLSDVTPAELDNVPVGGEVIVVARSNRREVFGDLTLKGRVGEDAFEQKYPVRVVFSPANAFTPRLAAAARIAELERTSGARGKEEMVALSKELHVASPYTSLLVLESDAMYDAFGINRESLAPVWTGEEQAESSSVSGAVPVAPVADLSSLAMLGAIGGSASAAGAAAAPSLASGRGMLLDTMGSGAGGARRSSPRLFDAHEVVRWSRTASFSGDAGSFERQASSDIPAAEEALERSPDNRSRLATLYKLYARAGRLDSAEALVKRWIGKDPLDPDATRARADLAARGGDRQRALRIIGGVLDAKPDDVGTHTRLAKTFDAEGDKERACAHRTAIADARPGDTVSVAAAIRCAREVGVAGLADALRADLSVANGEAVDRLLTLPPPDAPRGLSGDIQLEGTWDTDSDLDLALIDTSGRRISWLGAGGTPFTVTTPTGERGEGIGYVGLAAGSFAIEVSRAKPGDVRPVTGTLVVRYIGQTQKVPFTLTAPRAVIGRIEVKVEPFRDVVGLRPDVVTAPPRAEVQVGVATPSNPIANTSRVLAGIRASLRACYNAGLQQDPALQGRLVLQVHVAVNGEVEAVEAVSNSGIPQPTLSCVLRRVRNVSFDPPGQPSTLAVPITFVQLAP